MTSCPKTRELLLRGSLDGDVAAHLETCETCRAEVESLETWKGAVAAWDPSRGSSVVSPSRVEALVRTAEARAAGAPRHERRRLVAWTAGAAAACAAAVLAVVISGGDAAPATRVVETGPNEHTVVTAGDDRIGLDIDTRVAITESEGRERLVELERGTIAVAAKKRERDAALVVRAGGVSVHVTGTRFSVSRRPAGGGVRVALEEGGVRVVISGGEVVRLWPGSSFLERGGVGEVGAFSPGDAEEIEALLVGRRPDDGSRPPEVDARPEEPREGADAELPLDAPPAEQAPLRATPGARPQAAGADVGIDAARRMILDGRVDEARAALERIVAASPDDAEAWMLLATCHRKLGNWAEAVRAYSIPGETGSARQAGQARYMAATVLQDKLGQPARARSLLEEYVRGAPETKPLEAKALLRLAQVDLAIGDVAAARAAWEALRRSYPGTEEEKRAAVLVGEK